MITEEYREEMKKLHKNPNFGVASKSYAPMVADFLNKSGATEVLDYGAGKGNLAKTIAEQGLLNNEVAFHHYEPANPEWDKKPDSRQVVVCIDVLEHIEPDMLEEVLDDLLRCTENYGIFTVHTGAAGKTLSDGRNAHLIQAPPKWWLPKICDRWELIQFQAVPNGFFVIVKRYGA